MTGKDLIGKYFNEADFKALARSRERVDEEGENAKYFHFDSREFPEIIIHYFLHLTIPHELLK